jgi:hypothetical protein
MRRFIVTKSLDVVHNGKKMLVPIRGYHQGPGTRDSTKRVPSKLFIGANANYIAPPRTGRPVQREAARLLRKLLKKRTKPMAIALARTRARVAHAAAKVAA